MSLKIKNALDILKKHDLLVSSSVNDENLRRLVTILNKIRPMAFSSAKEINLKLNT